MKKGDYIIGKAQASFKYGTTGGGVICLINEVIFSPLNPRNKMILSVKPVCYKGGTAIPDREKREYVVDARLFRHLSKKELEDFMAAMI